MSPLSPGAPFAPLHADGILVAQAFFLTLLLSVVVGSFGHHGHVAADSQYNYTMVIRERLLGYDKLYDYTQRCDNYLYRRPSKAPWTSSSSPCTTTVDVYVYYVNVYPTTPETYVAPSTPSLTRTSTGKRVPLPSKNDSTTTSTTVAERLLTLLPSSNQNHSENARFEGITPRRPPVKEGMCDV
ncbi:hypothetical protein CFC21_052368 [Triticum aestivum]|uniref:Uncharacterized protein n=3 Tax=Triticum TaxID=4564 RepID=A0A9R0VZ25_TRITD|nr:hypothetical protein CFC21_052368 [Triticum aestivum]VAH91252.1 unnamed protein product [Triticum turgidum subsp. durum]